jgi:biopolymer transport protein ExbB
MVKVMEETGEVESIRLHQHVGWLAIIGAIAPMLGLLGTVLGMTFAFAVIGASDTQPSPRVLANYIQLALITTVEGLTVAVPVLLGYAYFKNKVVTLMLEVGVVASGLIDRFKGVQITPSMLAGVKEQADKGRRRAKPAATPATAIARPPAPPATAIARPPAPPATEIVPPPPPPV